MITETAKALRGAGWRVERASAPRPLPAHIAERYPNVPPLAAQFMTAFTNCVRGDEACWLLTAADFDDSPSPDGFRWDEFERIFTEPGPPIEGVRTRVPSPEEVAEARRWWDGHLPIFQFVGGDYEFAAIDVDPGSPDFGKVVGADVMDYDAALPLADSFEDFLTKLRDAALAPPTRSSVYHYDLARYVHADIIEDGSRPPYEKKGLFGRIAGWFGRGRR